jgi:hypothetical protein
VVADKRVMIAGIVLVVSLTYAATSFALGVRYPDPIAMASGTRTDVVGRLAPQTMTWSLEVSELRLFDDAGLDVAGARGVLALGAWRAGLEVASMSTGVGRETHVCVRFENRTPAWSVAIAVARDAAQIGTADAIQLTSLSMQTGVSIGDYIVAHCDLGGFRVSGIDADGADIETGLTVVAPERVAVTSILIVDRSAGAHARVSAAVRILSPVVAVAGYDDENASLSLAIAINAVGARAVALASVHPVLGISRGVSVRWTR